MARQLRSVNTAFWADEYIGELDRDAKLLFLYFLTNPLTSIAGVYKITRRVIQFDTGLSGEELDNILAKFEADGKVIYRDGWVVLPNFLKNQSLNPNQRQAVVKELLDSPDWAQAITRNVIESSKHLFAEYREIKGYVSLSNSSEPFERVSTAIERVKTRPPNRREYEYEHEHEYEDNFKHVSGTANPAQANAADPEAAEVSTSAAIDQKAKKPSKGRGTRLPADFTVTDEMLMWAKDAFPDVSPAFETEKFRDYWSSRSGSAGVKLDWVATWRNWIRNANDYAQGRKGYGYSNGKSNSDQKRPQQTTEQLIADLNINATII